MHVFSQEEGFELINPPITIVILGSSTAAGNGASPISNSWVNKYREYVQVFNPKNQVINLAKGGYNTYHLLPTDSELTRKRRGPDTLRNFTKALQFKPAGIIVNLPSNDIANGYSVDEQLANFRYYSKFCDSNDIELWITTTQARNFPRKRMRLLQRDVKDSLNSIFPNTSIDFWTGFCDQDFRLLEDIDSGDGCHLNNGGHKLLTDRVIESHAFRGELDKSGALRSIRIELQEEMPPYLLSVGFEGKIDKDSIYHTGLAKVKIVQDNRVLAVYLAENDFYQIEANVDVRLPVEIVFESNY
jgi:lysophospholipase L1-like esterase